MRHVEIETVNRKLLDNLSKIMQNDYKSAVKTAISNRKYIVMQPKLFNKIADFLNLHSIRSSKEDNESECASSQRKHAAHRPRKSADAQSTHQRQEHFQCARMGTTAPNETKTAQKVRCAPLHSQLKVGNHGWLNHLLVQRRSMAILNAHR